jgi:hypothetical protein
MRWLWVAGVGMVLAAASACGGGEKAAPVLSDADRKNIVTVSSEGLPTPLTLQSDTATTNPQAAGAFADPQKWAANYQKWGRTGGHEASFGVAGGQDAAAQTQAEAYKTTSGAKDALSGLRDFMVSGEALQAYANLGYTDVKIDAIDAAKIGDDSSAYRLVVSMTGAQFDTLVIIFRRGPVLAQASVGSAPDTSDLADVEAIASQMDGRIQNILNGQPLSSQGN